jgi:hypothetical protein
MRCSGFSVFQGRILLPWNIDAEAKPHRPKIKKL